LVFPELLIREDVINISLDNHRFYAGVLAIVVAWFSKNILITILAGMAALFLLQFFL
jgi:branched-subunit amino acid transport protein